MQVLYHMFEGFSHLGQENLIMQDYFAAVLSFLLVALGGTAIGIIWGFLTAFVTRSVLSYINAHILKLLDYFLTLCSEVLHKNAHLKMI